MNFEEALASMKQGKRMRRMFRSEYIRKVDTLLVEIKKFPDSVKVAELTSADILADDWEEYE